MINVNELRIGNYILDEKGRIKRAWLIKQNSIQTSDYDINESEIDPIPLTRDILIACGFELFLEHVNPHISYNKTEIILFKRNDSYWLGAYKNCSVKYLHQLQNLYFSLTGKELEYKPK